jgi:pimeloyl-ACP methyl ester carboxylesterase
MKHQKMLENGLKIKIKKILPVILLVMGVSSAYSQDYGIGNIQHTFIDPARNDRPILTEIYFPVPADENKESIADGSFPLLVFGHGFVMTWGAYENLWTHFVPQGYVMAFPRTESGFSPSHLDFGLDIAFLAEAMQDLAADPSTPLYDGLNGRAAVMGHSMGGGASVLAAATGSEYIHALLNLAPAETSPSAIAAAESVAVPSLIFAGSSDDVTPESTHQIPIYEALASESKSYVSIIGGGHCFFANYNFNCAVGESFSSGNITITREEQQQTTSDFATPWLDYFLKDDCEAWTLFQDSLVNSSRIDGMQYSIIQNPEVSLADDMLISTPASSYQWYFNDTPINGAAEQSYTPQQDGDYTVEVSYFNQCIYVSEPFSYSSGVEVFNVVFDVTDQHGEPVSNAAVIFNDTENEAGDYLFEGVAPGTYDFLVTAACYLPSDGQTELVDADIVIEIVLDKLTGDANGDGTVNVLDVIALVNYYTGNEAETFCFENADVNDDGLINVLDVIGTVNIFSNQSD